MRATVGDHIVLMSEHPNGQDLRGEILEVRGADGASPYVVRWSDNGHEVLFFPGPDARIDLREHDDPLVEP